MILHRPHRGGLAEAMKEMREFESLGELIDTIVAEHNYSIDWFQITPDDLCIIKYGNGDDRIGWEDVFMICMKPYNSVNDKEGYFNYWHGKYDHELQFGGFFTTKWK